MSPVFFMFVDRQKAYDVIEAVTGFPDASRVVPASAAWRMICARWETKVREFIDWLRPRMDQYEKAGAAQRDPEIALGRRGGVRTRRPRWNGHHRPRTAFDRLQFRPPQGAAVFRLREFRFSRYRWQPMANIFDRAVVRRRGNPPVAAPSSSSA